MLTDVALRSTSQLVIGRAVAALIRRKTDAKAIAGLARFLREAPVEDPYEVALEFAAIALAESKHPRAVAAAIAAYRAIERGTRPGFFLVQTLSNRVERDRVLRTNRTLVDLLVEVAGSNDEENADAILAPAHARDPRTVRDLIALLRHRDAYVQQTAALALIRIGRPTGLVAARAFIKR
jgi:HEAT repeat protein